MTIRAKKKDLKTKPAVANGQLERWANRGVALAKVKDGNQWAIGDWLLSGEKDFGKKKAYDKAQSATGMTRATLQQFKYTAECFPISTRVKKLSFGHHRLVADKRLTPNDRKRLLQHAKDSGESVASFAAFLRSREKDALRRADKRSPADLAASKVMAACAAFLRNHNIEMVLNEPPTPAVRAELLGRLKKAADELNNKMEQLAKAWRDHDAADQAFKQGGNKALGAGA
jgi:hypothetical protein